LSAGWSRERSVTTRDGRARLKYTWLVDALDADDREQALKLSPARKLEQALETMRAGIRLKRSTLRRKFPAASEAEVDQRLADWLVQDG
jgi:hypothetical protein